MNSAPGAGIAARLGRIGAQIAERELDALLVEDAADLRYVTGYTGSNGLALLRGADEPAPDFLTDFRYTEQSAIEVPPLFERATVTGELRDSLPSLLGDGGGRLGFDETKLTVRAHARMSELLGPRWELVPADGLVESSGPSRNRRRSPRSPRPPSSPTQALRRDARTRSRGADRARRRARARDGACAASAQSSRASPRSSPRAPTGRCPHAQPRDVEIPRDVLVTIDWGALHEGYCSDCTRTYATGEGISAQAREVYELVLAAQQAGLDAVRAGLSGREVDAVARAVIDGAGPGRALRARARARRRTGDPRGPAALADGLRAAAARRATS